MKESTSLVTERERESHCKVIQTPTWMSKYYRDPRLDKLKQYKNGYATFWCINIFIEFRDIYSSKRLEKLLSSCMWGLKCLVTDWNNFGIISTQNESYVFQYNDKYLHFKHQPHTIFNFLMKTNLRKIWTCLDFGFLEDIKNYSSSFLGLEYKISCVTPIRTASMWFWILWILSFMWFHIELKLLQSTHHAVCLRIYCSLDRFITKYSEGDNKALKKLYMVFNSSIFNVALLWKTK